jgi:4-azaleucine resistance transporter AzlC
MTSPSIPLSTQPSRVTEFWAGARAILPLTLAVFPFGIIYGVLAMKAGMGVWAAQSMSFIIFAGSAQFVCAQLVASGVPALIIILTLAVVNLRHALYSASLAPSLRKLSPLWKLLLSYLLTDEAYAVTVLHYNERGSDGYQHWFFFGSGLGLWTCWQISTAVGIFLGAVVPQSWPLDFALPLTFIALVFPALKDKSSVTSALVAGVVALTAYNLPLKLGIVLAALVGITAGLLVEGRK